MKLFAESGLSVFDRAAKAAILCALQIIIYRRGSPADIMDNLEEKIDELVELANDLKRENSVLHERESRLIKERSLLLEKNDKARTRVERMIIRLKALNSEG